MSLPVVFPRVFQLRQIQAKEGVDLTNLRLKNRGLAPINCYYSCPRFIRAAS